MQSDSSTLVICFVIWTLLALLLLGKRNWQITFRTGFVLLTGYAVLAALASPRGNEWFRGVANKLDGGWAVAFTFVLITIVAVFILRVSET